MLPAKIVHKPTPRDYKFLRVLGEGSFSYVYLAVEADSLSDTPECKTKVRKYAIKVCNKSLIKREGKQVAIMREKEIMNVLNQRQNEHFIKLFYTFQDHERLYFVMSYAKHGDLLTYMHKSHRLKDSTVRKFTIQLVDALEFMHKFGIVHRDLKPENILINEQRNIQISDFGSAQIYKTPLNSPPLPADEKLASDASQIQHQISSNNKSGTSNETQTPRNHKPGMPVPLDRRNSFVGTAQYVSPEMLKFRQASNKSDLWALGVIIYQMHTNKMPFDAPNEYLVYQKIQNLDFEYDDDFDEEIREMCDSLIRLEPMERAGASDNLYEDGYVTIRQSNYIKNRTAEDAAREDSPDIWRPDTQHDTIDEDLIGIEKIERGFDESQQLRLLAL